MAESWSKPAWQCLLEKRLLQNLAGSGHNIHTTPSMEGISATPTYAWIILTKSCVAFSLEFQIGQGMLHAGRLADP